ncbi:MAG: ROK family protein, partial [Thermomicrobiales bacterium]|nr:ROK family protein [Thermomicrobiales bacterium]
LGTGIGGGLVIHGRLYRGARGLAGEIGHMVVDPTGPRCNCGSRGCLEALVSGVAFANRARRLLSNGRSDVLREIVGYAEPTSRHLYQAAVAGDRLCEAEIRNGGHVLGLALGSLVNVLNPDMVTLSGGLLQVGAMLLEPARRAMFSLAYGPAAATALETTHLGDDAGLLGAAAVAFERVTESSV